MPSAHTSLCGTHPPIGLLTAGVLALPAAAKPFWGLGRQGRGGTGQGGVEKWAARASEDIGGSCCCIPTLLWSQAGLLGSACSNADTEPRRSIFADCCLPGGKGQMLPFPWETSGGILAGLGSSARHFSPAGALSIARLRFGLSVANKHSPLKMCRWQFDANSCVIIFIHCAAKSAQNDSLWLDDDDVFISF